ncbi:MAG: MazG nucleotide pyrophosphohydrolase [Spirosoma sp.]|nr:MazG nucleotide pyrophosphohydrolase [Spirosoma sp.]
MIRATVSGSFHRHMTGIAEAVATLGALGVDVLSPSDPRVVDHDGEFLFVASDRLRSRRLVQDRHLEAIRASDFLWVVCPDGYTGPSTAGEIMAASVLGKPIYSTHAALDITIGDYVERVATMGEAITRARRDATGAGVGRPRSALLRPEDLGRVAEEVHDLGRHLTAHRGDGRADAERRFGEVRRLVRGSFSLPNIH